MDRNSLFTKFTDTYGGLTFTSTAARNAFDARMASRPAVAAAPIPPRPTTLWEPDPVKLSEAHASIEYINQVAAESRRIGAESWARNRHNKGE